MIGLIFMFYTVFIVIAEPLTGKFGSFQSNYSKMDGFVFLGIFRTFPTAIFSFLCQVNVQDVLVVINLILILSIFLKIF